MELQCRPKHFCRNIWTQGILDDICACGAADIKGCLHSLLHLHLHHKQQWWFHRGPPFTRVHSEHVTCPTKLKKNPPESASWSANVLIYPVHRWAPWWRFRSDPHVITITLSHTYCSADYSGLYVSVSMITFPGYNRLPARDLGFKFELFLRNFWSPTLWHQSSRRSNTDVYMLVGCCYWASLQGSYHFSGSETWRKDSAAPWRTLTQTPTALS